MKNTIKINIVGIALALLLGASGTVLGQTGSEANSPPVAKVAAKGSKADSAKKAEKKVVQERRKQLDEAIAQRQAGQDKAMDSVKVKVREDAQRLKDEEKSKKSSPPKSEAAAQGKDKK